MNQDPRDQLLSALLRRPRPLELEEPLLSTAARAYAVLNPDLEELLVLGVPRLLRQLRHHNERQRVASMGEARGAYDFPATYKLQATRGPGAVVSRRPVQRWDLPENRLLPLLCQDLRQALNPRADWAGLRCWDRRHKGLPARERVSRLELAMLRLEQHPHLKGLMPPDIPHGLDDALRRALDTGQSEYQSLAEQVRTLRALRQVTQSEELLALLPRVVVLPTEPSDQDATWVALAQAAINPERPHAPVPRPPQPGTRGGPVSRRRPSDSAMAS